MRKFGYPKNCILCSNLYDESADLNVLPYFSSGSNFKIMIIGQDPTIDKEPERVNKVLMLDIENSRLRNWLIKLIGDHVWNSATIYATNSVKCTFNMKPSKLGGYKFLLHYFNSCKNYLINEILNYKPSIAISLGEDNHKLITSVFDNSTLFLNSMNKDFTGDFYSVSIKSYDFLYSPCIHIQTVLRNKKYYEIPLNNLSNNIKEIFNGENKK